MVHDPHQTDYDFARKYETRGRLAAALLDGFFESADRLLHRAGPAKVLEVGCGEGFSTQRLRAALGSDVAFESGDVEQRLVEASRRRNPTVPIQPESVYDLQREDASFDLVVCMEVLEHLEHPAAAMRELCRVSARWLLLSVPREPLWRVLNMARLHYLRDLGNTPGHRQHWSRSAFVRFVARFAVPAEVRAPLPWTQVLARVRP